MNYFIVINENVINEVHIQASTHNNIMQCENLGNGQIKLQIEDRFDPAFDGLVKYTTSEIDALVLSLRDSNGDLIPGKTIVSTQAQVETAGETPVYIAFTDTGLQALAKGDKGDSGLNKALTDKQKLSNLLELSSVICWVGDSIAENVNGFVSKIELAYPIGAYTNKAVGGYTTKDLITNIADTVAVDAKLYIIEVGLNDIRYNDARGVLNKTDYITNMTSIINSLKAIGSVAVISIWPSHYKDQFSSLKLKATNDKIKQYNKALEKLCFELDILFIDTYKPITKAVNIFNVDAVTIDGVHPAGVGIDLYADSVLKDRCCVKDSEYDPNGKHFFRIKFLNHEHGGAGGYLGIVNIDIAPIEEKGITANLPYTTANVYGAYNAGAAFYNFPNDFPFNLLFSTNTYPDACNVTSVVSGTGAQRGPRSFIVYYSENPEAYSDLDHPSWEAVSREMTNKALAINILPQSRVGVFYMFIGDGVGTLNMKSLKCASSPIRTWIQNILSTSKQRFVELFNGTLVASADGLNGNLPNYVVIWESPTTLTEIDVQAFSGLTGFRIKKSYDPNCIDNPGHSSWKEVATGSVNGIVNI